MPRPGNYAPAAIDPVGPLIEFRSNVFYNWGGSAAGYNADTTSNATYAFIDNAYVTGPDTKRAIAFREENALAKSWFARNSMNGVVPADPWSLVTGVGARLSVAPDIAPVLPDEAASAYARVLASAGASKVRDAVDARIVATVVSRSGSIIDSQDQVGGWPDLKSKHALALP